MAVLRWKHGRSAVEMTELVKTHLAKTGNGDNVHWEGSSFSASVGLGMALNIKGHITDDELVIEKSGGVGGSIALSKIRKTLEEKYPGGEVA